MGHILSNVEGGSRKGHSAQRCCLAVLEKKKRVVGLRKG